MAPGKLPGCSGSRNLHNNISDLRAQVAANQKVNVIAINLVATYFFACDCLDMYPKRTALQITTVVIF